MKTHRRAFTLIELLVVIAIIAILAAILFPVFAQAKVAAKNAADISNNKQLDLGLIMYANDYDDRYCPANGQDNGNPNEVSNFTRTWVEKVQPYIKSLPIFQSGLDGNHSAVVVSWATTYSPDDFKNAIGISYAPNGYAHSPGSPGMITACTVATPCVMGGVMNQDDDPPAPSYTGAASDMPETKTSTQVTQPAGTVLLADLFTSAMQKESCCGFSNLSEWFSAAFIQIRVPGDLGAQWDWFGPEDIPNGTALTTNPFPTGPSGGVSITSGLNSNFAFVDGHVKSMNPAATDPDPINKPQSNMWDADR
jgi:prepilin-type N-terminal cleavage/methylation domain-containing protein/prepilin-type processing-associated H-X9-DG protein